MHSKARKTVRLNAIALLLCGVSVADQSGDYRTQLTRFAEMTTAIKTSNLSTFQRRIQSSGWTAPKIFSSAYVERLPNDAHGAKTLEQAKSDFGLELARSLTNHAALVRAESDSAKLEQLNQPLFELVNWLGHETAYGNMMLQSRAYDVASVIAVKLIADLSYPIGKAEGQLARFDWAWSTAEKRRIVLNEESGFAAFAQPQAGDIQQSIQEEWARNLHASLGNASQPATQETWLFAVNDVPRDATIALPESTWKIGLHRLLVDGWDSANLRNAAGLMEFRKRYGEFPIKPKQYKKRDSESDIQAAFWELCWHDPHGLGGAWVAYGQYVNGSLCDDGELQHRLLNSKTTSADSTKTTAASTNAVPTFATSPKNSRPPETKVTTTTNNQPPDSIPWALVVAMIAAACGLLWLLLKRRS